MAGAAAEKRSALWEIGGVCLYGYGDGATPAELQTKSSAHPGIKGTGKCGIVGGYVYSSDFIHSTCVEKKFR